FQKGSYITLFELSDNVGTTTKKTTTEPPDTTKDTEAIAPEPEEAGVVVVECADGDGTCPEGCNVFNDNDCPALKPGTSADVGDLRITVSNPQVKVCTSSYSNDKDTYIVFDVIAENMGIDTQYISSMEFYVIDPNKKQFDGSLLAYPMVFGGNCADAKDTAFDGGNLLPSSKDDGKIWIEISNTGSYTAGKWYIIHKQLFSLRDYYTIYETQIK
ncbi:MAG: DUF4352 domain-containing protein, partial [Candidatus Micrarchaeota archaeon]